MTTYTASRTVELPKINPTVATVAKEISNILILFACAAIPTLLLSLRWVM